MPIPAEDQVALFHIGVVKDEIEELITNEDINWVDAIRALRVIRDHIEEKISELEADD